MSLDDFELVDFDTNSKVIGMNDKKLQGKMLQLFDIDIDSTRGLKVLETVLPVNREYFAFGHVSQEIDGQFVLANGPEGSFLTSKDESKVLDWMDSRVFKAKLFAGLFAIAAVSPLAFLIKPEQLGIGVFIFTLLAVLIAFLVINQIGKKYELAGDS